MKPTKEERLTRLRKELEDSQKYKDIYPETYRMVVRALNDRIAKTEAE